MLLLSGYCHWNCFSISWTLKWNTWCYSSLFLLQQEKIQALQSFADLLINGEHYDSDAIQDKRDQVLDRWSKLKEALIDNRSKLGEAQTLQQFSRDADEMENWLQEKLQIAMDESYKDPTNIQVSYLRTF